MRGRSRLHATSAPWATSLGYQAELVSATGLFARGVRESALSASCVCGPTTSEPLCRVRTSRDGEGHMPKSIGHNADGGHILASFVKDHDRRPLAGIDAAHPI